ncbi:MAG: type I DNA topoisomerase [Candidatus Coatesbacteria bacterium]|nr:type I DNA topoisomerase [Candidatus Coatesbacteria bacterium]
MTKILVIVESPAKAKTLKKYLGSSFEIYASMGHIRDLPKEELGINLESNFKPVYIIPKEKDKIVKQLISASKKADTIYLAPDPDREGEAIAWHLSEILKEKLPKKEVKRILFNEISKNAVQKAVKNPMDIDYNKVDAQQTRRILDRLVGYKISPFLWKTVYSGLSAGRVQTVALRLLCEKEEEIRNFKQEEFWTIEGIFKPKTGKEFTSELAKIKNKKPVLPDKKTTDDHIEKIKKEIFSITDYEEKEVKRYPYPPFITSTLQQEASRRLGMSSNSTMRIAQDLYEGVELGKEGSTALITYMRTDSTRLSKDSIESARRFIEKGFLKEYLPEKPVQYIPKKSSQDAHEAIRPIDPEKTPEMVKHFLSREQHKLYKLIWERFIACQMSPSIRKQVTLKIESESYEFQTNGSVLIFDGFQKVYPPYSSKENPLPPQLEKNTKVDLVDLKGSQHFTQPPASYTEATLIKELEEKGIGRPSTYASIISTLKDRKYIEIKEKKFIPTEIGERVWKILKGYFPNIFEVTFTAHMEEELDQIISGKETMKKVLNEFYNPFEEILKVAFNNSKEAKKMITEVTEEKCDLCGSAMVVRWSKYGKFLACSRYPKCTGKKNIMITPKDKEIEKTGYTCPNCGGAMVIRKGRFGEFLACSAYPNCKTTMSIPTGVKCPQTNCGGELVIQGKGAVCNRKECSFKVPYKPINEPCPVCGFPFLLDRITRTENRHKYCLRCKHKEPIKQEK